MDAFWPQFLKYYLLIPFLMMARPVKNLVEMKMPDCGIKRVLLWDSHQHKFAATLLIIVGYAVMAYFVVGF